MALTPDEKTSLMQRARGLRRDIVEITAWSGGAHIGGSLSVIDILTYLYFHELDIRSDEPEWPDRDRLILSKGHSAVGYTAVLARRGYYDFDLLKSFNKFGSPFGMHPDGNKITGCDASTGSLGHGLPIAVGLALGAKIQGAGWRVFCIVGDGELNEGSNWEAMMAAAHHKLDNLTLIVDRNRMMIDGPTEEVMSLEPLADKLTAFGMSVWDIDGHDFDDLCAAVDGASAGNAPGAIIANTVKGKGVDFMEDEVPWHYGSVDSELRDRALASIERMYEGVPQ
ncbi:MAG: transketolase [Halioglobus sp.]|nr:transketolase [Halioglobus sp.]